MKSKQSKAISRHSREFEVLLMKKQKAMRFTVVVSIGLCLLTITSAAQEMRAGRDEPIRATDERIVKDPLTAIALGGYDPVSYFLFNREMKGSTDYQTVYDGAVWIFASRANRKVFEDAPQVYIPQFGGYGATAIAQGRIALGLAENWLIEDGKLYLFHSPASRHAWTLDPKRKKRAAEENWPKIERALPR